MSNAFLIEMGRRGNSEPCSVKIPKSILAATGPGLDVSSASLKDHETKLGINASSRII